MSWPINPRKIKRRHVVAINEAEWEFAAELGRLQETPVGPHAVLLNAVRKYLHQKSMEMRSEQARAVSLAVERHPAPYRLRG
jgi:hypothetical protein